MTGGIGKEEVERIDRIYRERSYDTDMEYSDINSTYLQRVHSMERATLASLNACGLDKRLAELKVLDFGCGNGRWFGRWIAWGANPTNLTGVDLRTRAVELARQAFPQCRFETLVHGQTPCLDASFDIVYQNLVFSSILEDSIRQTVATEMARVLKPDGVLFLCDFVFNNPNNRNVRAVKEKELLSLFPEFQMVLKKRIILVPPIARHIVPVSWIASNLIEALFPFLRSHQFIVLKKVGFSSTKISLEGR